MGRDLKIEVNEAFMAAITDIELPGGIVVSVTPPLDGEYWAARVPIDERQAVVCFPKFGTIGIGFQHEDHDWNTNLPYRVSAEDIYEHIKVNKNRKGKRCRVERATIIEAIEILRQFATAVTGRSADPPMKSATRRG